MTVYELNLKAKSLLETHFQDIKLSGELSKITFHSSGHWYFDLKDDRASIACVIFKGFNSKLDFTPKVGDFLDLEGNLSLFEASGRYQFIAKNMQKGGLGDLEAKFLALKDKLEKEGLFDTKYKKKLALFPKKIAIITSLTSAALQDMLKLITQKQYFLAQIYVFNALTQGKEAPLSLINALKKADDLGFDFIIMARGGGSREDLFCFNDEALARTIFELKTPLVSAIGHEIDYVISDFVADLRAPTPSAAIDFLFPNKTNLEQSLDMIEEGLKKSLNQQIHLKTELLKNMQRLLKAHSLNKIIEQNSKQLILLKNSFHSQITNKFNQIQLKITSLEKALLQHKSFLNKSSMLVSLTKDGKIVQLDKLKSNDEIVLHSQTTSKKAKIL